MPGSNDDSNGGFVACLFEAGEHSPYETIRFALIDPSDFEFARAGRIRGAGNRAGQIDVLRDGHDGVAGAWG